MCGRDWKDYKEGISEILKDFAFKIQFWTAADRFHPLEAQIFGFRVDSLVALEPKPRYRGSAT